MVLEVISHYRIISRLGAGGMGEVFLAEDTKLERKIAIKLLPRQAMFDEQANKRLIREAKAAATLDHPNICAIHEAGQEDDRTFIVMQYVEGETLSTILKQRQLEFQEAVEIAIQVTSALAEAHNHGIIHRDIKPQNIILTPRGQVKVLDFGLAKILWRDETVGAEAETMTNLTASGAVIGTAAYMSPEQVTGAPTDMRTDIFSLGAMFYECLTGKRAFAGANALEICGQVMHVNPSPPSNINPNIPHEIDRIIVKALAKDSRTRYQSAKELLADLTDVRESIRPHSRSNSPSMAAETSPPDLSRILWARKSIRAYVIAVSFLALLCLGAVYYFRSQFPPQPSPEAKRWYEEGTSALRDGSYYQATRALDRAVRIDDRFGLAHARLAEAWIEMGYSDRAKDELLLATSLTPDRTKLPRADSLYLDAITSVVRRDFAQAIEHYGKIAEEATDSKKAQAYVELGRAYEKNEEMGKALESYLEAIKLDPQYASAYLRLGVLYGRQQNLGSANESFDKAEAIYEASSNMEGITEVLFQRGFLLNRLDKAAEARKQLERALAIGRTTDNKYQQIRSLLQLSSVSWTEGSIAAAQQFATEAIEMAQTDNLENLATSGLIDLGTTFFLRGEYSEAEKYYKQAIDFAQRAKEHSSEARAILSLGSLRVQQGNADEGLRLVDQSLTYYQPGGYKRQTSQALILLGRAYQLKGDYAGALGAFQQQLEIANQLGDPSQVSVAHNSLATLLGHYQERYTEALAHFNEASKIDESLNARLRFGYDLMNRANIVWQLGRYEEARLLFSQSASIANRPDASYKQLLAWMQLFMGRLSMSEQRQAEARSRFQKALDLAGTQYKDIAVQAMYSLGLTQAHSGSPQVGVSLCRQAIAMAKEMSNPRLLSRANLALAEVLFESGDWQNAITYALSAQEIFTGHRQEDSEWHALLIAARASERLGNESDARDFASRAASLLSTIEQELGTESFNGYNTRPDIRERRSQLGKMLAANP